VKSWIAVAVLLVGGTAVGGEAKRPLLYAGKTFEQWRDSLDVEISPKERIEAVKALTAFGVRGRADDCTRALLGLTAEYLVVEKKGNLGDEEQVLEALKAARDRLGVQAGRVFREVLRDPKSPLRRAVARLVDTSAAKVRWQILPELAAALADEDEEVRSTAEYSLVWSAHKLDGDTEAAVLRVTSSPRAGPRAAAIKVASQQVRPELVAPRLAAMLREYDDDQTLEAALEAVCALGTKAQSATAAVLAVLEGPILTKGRWRLASPVAKALAKLGTKDREAAPMLRRAAAYLLAHGKKKEREGFYPAAPLFGKQERATDLEELRDVIDSVTLSE
jgi:hypothetical protein